MKLAVSSSLYDRALAAGELTHIEWIDVCARTLGIDGIVFDLRHFPRTDSEYTAQVKKMCVDLGLTVAALEAGRLLEISGDEPAAFAQPFEVAAAIGAPLLVATAPAPDDAALGGGWHGAVRAAKLAARAAKSVNVTIALRNASQTLCESSADLKRAAKEIDSAWIRFAPDITALESDCDFAALLPKTVIATYQPRAFDTSEFHESAAGAIAASLRQFRGFLFVGAAAGEAPREAAAVPAYLNYMRKITNEYCEDSVV